MEGGAFSADACPTSLEFQGVDVGRYAFCIKLCRFWQQALQKRLFGGGVCDSLKLEPDLEPSSVYLLFSRNFSHLYNLLQLLMASHGLIPSHNFSWLPTAFTAFHCFLQLLTNTSLTYTRAQV